MEENFDQHIKKVYNSGEYEYNATNWHILQQKMNTISKPTKSKRMMGLMAVFSVKKMMAAASLLFVLGLSALYFLQNKNINIDTHSQTVSINQVSPKQKNEVPISEVNSSNHPFPLPHAKPTQLKYTTSHNNISKNKTISPIPNFTTQNNHELTTSIQKESLTQNSSSSFSQKINTTSPEKETLLAKNIIQNTSEKHLQNPFINQYQKDDPTSSSELSVIGSIGKGWNNSIYSAGINYQLALSNHFFIDGALAMYSSDIQDVLTLSNRYEAGVKTLGNTSGGSFAVSDLQSMNTERAVQHASYAHLAVNPSIGYKINTRFSVKAGLDVQKRISKTQDLTYVESNSTFRPLPNIDLGFTPKLGIVLSKHWQSNFIYRKGINNIISKKDYFNRTYFQLQLGYKL